jgi:hypothetical protein
MPPKLQQPAESLPLFWQGAYGQQRCQFEELNERWSRWYREAPPSRPRTLAQAASICVLDHKGSPVPCDVKEAAQKWVRGFFHRSLIENCPDFSRAVLNEVEWETGARAFFDYATITDFAIEYGTFICPDPAGWWCDELPRSFGILPDGTFREALLEIVVGRVMRELEISSETDSELPPPL